jgi:hypothetical protein
MVSECPHLHNQLQEFTHELDFAQKVVKSFVPMSTTQLVGCVYNLLMGVVICALAQSARQRNFKL